MRAVDNKFMKVVLEEVTAEIASVSIVDSKELCSNSFFLDVQSYAHSIFIVVP